MLGVPIDGPCRVFCDNDSVFKNVTRAKSPLRKKHCGISYHKAREAIAASTIRVANKAGSINLSNLLTMLLAEPKLRELSGFVMW